MEDFVLYDADLCMFVKNIPPPPSSTTHTSRLENAEVFTAEQARGICAKTAADLQVLEYHNWRHMYAG